MADPSRPSLDEFSSASVDDLSLPVFAGVSTPSSSHNRHGRSGSIHSTMSSLTVPLFPGAGTNKLPPEGVSLGPYSISSLVDGVAPNIGGPDPRSPSIRPHPTRSSAIAFKPPTQYDIPPVSLPKLPKIDRDKFDRYLSEITHEYDTFYGTKFANGDHGRHSSRNTSSNAGDDTLSVISASFSAVSPYEDDNSLTLPVSPLPASTDFDDIPEPLELTPLSTIPDIFFDENFQLDNPRVFDVVSEKSAVVDDSIDGATSRIMVSNSILQEKLTWYTDTVELHLIREISKASESFFSALDDLKNIRQRAAGLVERTDNINKCLKTVDNTIAIGGIKSLKLSQRRKNVARLAQTLDQLSLVLLKSDEAESVLLGKNDFSACIDTVDGVEALISGQFDAKGLVKSWTKTFQYPISNLRSLKGLEELRENIARLRNKAGESYSATLTTLLIEDLRRHVNEVRPEDAMKRLGQHIEGRFKKTKSPKKTINTDYMNTDDSFVQNLRNILQNLIRSGNVLSAIRLYKEAAIKEAKNAVRRVLPSTDDDTKSISSSMTGRTSTSASSLARSLREMNPLEVEKMLYQCYSAISELLRRLLTHQKLLLDVIVSIDDSPTGVMEINDILPSAVNITEKRMSNILRVRREQTTNLTMKQFLTYYFLNGMFISECEALCGDPCANLSSVLAEQIRGFVASFHSRNEKELSERMNKDQWKEVEITGDFQALVDRIVESSNENPAKWTDLITSVIKPEHYEEKTSKIETSDKKWPRNVFIGNSSFIIANGATIVTTMSESYLESALLLPHLAGEIISNLLNLIRNFNVITRQLILGAGAARTAGLKRISVKHLSLASESLNFICSLSDYMKKFCQRCVQNSALVDEFTDLEDNLKRHRSEIHKKFISLMTDKVNSHCVTISKTDWSLSTDEPHKYMQDLVKDMSILVKILRGILPRDSYMMISSSIFDMFKRRLLEAYTDINLKSSKEKQNVLKDVGFFKERLGNVEGAGNCPDIIYENINAISVPEPESFFDAGLVHDGLGSVDIEQEVKDEQGLVSSIGGEKDKEEKTVGNGSMKESMSDYDESMHFENSEIASEELEKNGTDDLSREKDEKIANKDSVDVNNSSQNVNSTDEKKDGKVESGKDGSEEANALKQSTVNDNDSISQGQNNDSISQSQNQEKVDNRLEKQKPMSEDIDEGTKESDENVIKADETVDVERDGDTKPNLSDETSEEKPMKEIKELEQKDQTIESTPVTEETVKSPAETIIDNGSQETKSETTSEPSPIDDKFAQDDQTLASISSENTQPPSPPLKDTKVGIPTDPGIIEPPSTPAPGIKPKPRSAAEPSSLSVVEQAPESLTASESTIEPIETAQNQTKSTDKRPKNTKKRGKNSKKTRK